MTEYFRSRYLAEPIIYVQEETEYQTIQPGGVAATFQGRIPEKILSWLEPMPVEQAERLLAAQYHPSERPEQNTSRTINLALRYLGILVPFPVSLGLFFSSGVPWPSTMVVSLTVWLAFAVALLVRRDWQGALAITVIYIFLNWWIIVFTALHVTPD